VAITNSLISSALAGDTDALSSMNAALAAFDAPRRIKFALQHLPGQTVLSSSFGAPAAVSLHLVTSVSSEIPIVLIDTGYLFPETYRFVDDLAQRLNLRLHISRPELSAAWLEARHGRLWEQDREGLEQYGEITKAEPMRRALQAFSAQTWLSGLRRSQSRSRAKVRALEVHEGRFKMHPIVDRTDRDVGRYLREQELPYHPLWEQGFISIGDWHTTHPLDEAGDAEAARFFGLKRECGLHGLEG